MKRNNDGIIAGRVVRGILALVFVVIVYSFANSLSYPYLNLTQNATTDIIYADGTTVHYDDLSFGMVNTGDTAVIHINLPADERIDSGVLRFFAYHVVISADYDGRQIYESGRDIADSGRMIGAQYPEIPIPNDAWGSTINVTLDVYEDTAFSKIEGISAYPQNESYRYYFDQKLFPILVSLVGLIAGLFAAVLLWTRGLRDKQIARGWYIAMAAFLMSTWVFCSTGVYHLISDAYFFRPVEYLALFVVAMPILAYMASDERNKRIRLILIVYNCVIAVATLIVSVFDYVGIAHYCTTLFIAHLLDLGAIFLLLYVSFLRMRRNDPSSRMLMVGFFSLCVFGLFDLLRFNILKFVPAFDAVILPSTLHLGITLFTLFMIVAYLVDTQEKSRRSLQLQVEVEELESQEREQRLMASMSTRYFIRHDHATNTAVHLFDSEKVFGIDPVQENAPYSYVEKGYIAEESRQQYSVFSRHLSEGQPEGHAVICINPPVDRPTAWLELEFKTEFFADGRPDYSIVSLRDITQEHERDVAFSLYRQQLHSKPTDQILYFEYDINKEECLFNLGDKAKVAIACAGDSWDGLINFIVIEYVQENEARRFLNLLNRKHLLQLAEQGQDSVAFDYQANYSRNLVAGDGTVTSASQWVHADVKLVLDQYTDDVKVYCLLEDIMGNKATEIALQNSVKKLEKELESSRVKIMVSQMQPHFLYNALSAIRTITKTDPNYAYDLLYDFTNHLRATVRALSSDDLIPFSEEMKNITAYLNIERMRFGDALKLEYDIECDDFLVAPLTIQPIAENAARHGVYPKGKEGGTVRIHSYEDADSYVVEVTDDGIGFDLDHVLNSKGDSVGLRSLIFRLDSLMHASVNIDSEIGKGTTVTVRIPKTKEADDSAGLDKTEDRTLPVPENETPAEKAAE